MQENKSKSISNINQLKSEEWIEKCPSNKYSIFNPSNFRLKKVNFEQKRKQRKKKQNSGLVLLLLSIVYCDFLNLEWHDNVCLDYIDIFFTEVIFLWEKLDFF